MSKMSILKGEFIQKKKLRIKKRERENIEKKMTLPTCIIKTLVLVFDVARVNLVSYLCGVCYS